MVEEFTSRTMAYSAVMSGDAAVLVEEPMNVDTSVDAATVTTVPALPTADAVEAAVIPVEELVGVTAMVSATEQPEVVESPSPTPQGKKAKLAEVSEIATPQKVEVEIVKTPVPVQTSTSSPTSIPAAAMETTSSVLGTPGLTAAHTKGWTVAKLKEELALRGLDISGLKVALAARLEAAL